MAFLFVSVGHERRAFHWYTGSHNHGKSVEASVGLYNFFINYFQKVKLYDSEHSDCFLIEITALWVTSSGIIFIAENSSVNITPTEHFQASKKIISSQKMSIRTGGLFMLISDNF